MVGQSSKALAQEIIERGIDTVLVTIDRLVLPERLCGERYTEHLITELPNNVDPCGEDGEFHTLVCNSKYFSHPIVIEPYR
ncbi:conserved hypothetical protein [Vibrio maritimus]|uniref:Diphthamide synthase domain-containing protein n=1 Tax=Vibrio maritimus TaxID=990268 RepID=A0A090TB41_9VIBR|nr:conserved hypothetical protein [Vibrio maritimus]